MSDYTDDGWPRGQPPDAVEKFDPPDYDWKAERLKEIADEREAHRKKFSRPGDNYQSQRIAPANLTEDECERALDRLLSARGYGKTARAEEWVENALAAGRTVCRVLGKEHTEMGKYKHTWKCSGDQPQYTNGKETWELSVPYIDAIFLRVPTARGYDAGWVSFGEYDRHDGETKRMVLADKVHSPNLEMAHNSIRDIITEVCNLNGVEFAQTTKDDRACYEVRGLEGQPLYTCENKNKTSWKELVKLFTLKAGPIATWVLSHNERDVTARLLDLNTSQGGLYLGQWQWLHNMAIKVRSRCLNQDRDYELLAVLNEIRNVTLHQSVGISLLPLPLPAQPTPRLEENNMAIGDLYIANSDLAKSLVDFARIKGNDGRGALPDLVRYHDEKGGLTTKQWAFLNSLVSEYAGAPTRIRESSLSDHVLKIGELKFRSAHQSTHNLLDKAREIYTSHTCTEKEHRYKLQNLFQQHAAVGLTIDEWEELDNLMCQCQCGKALGLGLKAEDLINRKLISPVLRPVTYDTLAAKLNLTKENEDMPIKPPNGYSPNAMPAADPQAMAKAEAVREMMLLAKAAGIDLPASLDAGTEKPKKLTVKEKKALANIEKARKDLEVAAKAHESQLEVQMVMEEKEAMVKAMAEMDKRIKEINPAPPTSELMMQYAKWPAIIAFMLAIIHAISEVSAAKKLREADRQRRIENKRNKLAEKVKKKKRQVSREMPALGSGHDGDTIEATVTRVREVTR